MARDFEAFKVRIEKEFLGHPVVVDNKYCKWFAEADLPVESVKHMVTQFSVFSHLFLIAALKKMINADSLESYFESKEILMNELGVIYRKKKSDEGRAAEEAKLAGESAVDPGLVSTEGTVDGGTYRNMAAHFVWLLKIGENFGLGFNDMGKRRHGTKSTVFFADELDRLYGAEDYNVCQGAGFAVENWAAAGFWKELISGLERFKADKMPALNVAFFTFHDKIEGQHKEHVWDELRECFDDEQFDEDVFMKAGVEMLNGVQAFWDGLYEDEMKAGRLGAAAA